MSMAALYLSVFLNHPSCVEPQQLHTSSQWLHIFSPRDRYVSSTVRSERGTCPDKHVSPSASGEPGPPSTERRDSETLHDEDFEQSVSIWGNGVNLYT
ncbi:unnamed protein product [Boreogadus saida]